MCFTGFLTAVLTMVTSSIDTCTATQCPAKCGLVLEPHDPSNQHQPPASTQSQGAFSGSWLPQQPHFTSLATVPRIQQNSLMPAQRSSTDTSDLREALLKIFPGSEQKLKINQTLVAHPYMKDLNALSALVLD